VVGVWAGGRGVHAWLVLPGGYDSGDEGVPNSPARSEARGVWMRAYSE
jgi:hypothetical protein